MSNAGGIVKQPRPEVIHRRWMQLRLCGGHAPAAMRAEMRNRTIVSYRFMSREPDQLAMRTRAERETAPTPLPLLRDSSEATSSFCRRQRSQLRTRQWKSNIQARQPLPLQLRSRNRAHQSRKYWRKDRTAASPLPDLRKSANLREPRRRMAKTNNKDMAPPKISRDEINVEKQRNRTPANRWT